MKIYKYIPRIHIATIIGFVLNVALFFLVDDFLLRIVLTFSAGFAVFNLINYVFTTFELTDKNFKLNSFISKTKMELSSIDFIGIQPSGKFLGESVLVKSGKTKVAVTGLIHNQWDLVSSLVESTKENKEIRVDSYVQGRVSN